MVDDLVIIFFLIHAQNGFLTNSIFHFFIYPFKYSDQLMLHEQEIMYTFELAQQFSQDYPHTR